MIFGSNGAKVNPNGTSNTLGPTHQITVTRSFPKFN